jgi:hypothetical protein
VGSDPGQHDFDWDIATWETHQKRLLHPLTGSTTWVSYSGTDVVRNIWGGRGNVGVIEADGPAGRLELLGVRLYNPKTHLWSIYFANISTGTLSVPSVGGFKNGRGEFYDEETLNGGPFWFASVSQILRRIQFISIRHSRRTGATPGRELHRSRDTDKRRQERAVTSTQRNTYETNTP